MHCIYIYIYIYIHTYTHIYTSVFEGNLEVKLPTCGQMQRQSWEESEKRENKYTDGKSVTPKYNVRKAIKRASHISWLIPPI